MAGENLPRLSPGAVGNDELDRRSILGDQCPVQFDGIRAGKKQKRPIFGTQEPLQIEGFSSFTADPHFAVHQGPEREQAGIAIARQFPVVNHQGNFRPQFDSRRRVAQAQSPRRRADGT